MKGANWWQNLIGELILSLMVVGMVALTAWTKNEHVPFWGWFIAVYIGVTRWNTVTFKDLP